MSCAGTVATCTALVLGAGRRGLAAALRLHAAGERVLLVDAAPQPGGSLRTQRSNGYSCELGAFALTAAELAPLLELLPQPPTPLAALPGAAHGFVFDGSGLQRAELAASPLSFRSGLEELAQGCRRALGASLWLGRPATAVRAAADGFGVDLGGEVPTRLQAAQLLLATPLRVAATLLAGFDAQLGAAAARLQHQPRALVFLGGECRGAPELTGYGIVPGEVVATPVAEVIHCSQVFAGRALPGRWLSRVELRGPRAAGTDADLVATALAELRHWTGLRASASFTKVQRGEALVADGTLAECRARLRALPARVPGLHLA